VRTLSALYVVEDAALGGRRLPGLVRLGALAGRQFFIGRGVRFGAAWVGYLGRLAAIGPKPAAQVAAVSAATETFTVFGTWLNHWNETK
jgi:heme oxygenase